jgi:two-component system cell cycle sensor histidine kinase/response regulator CckA
MSDAATGRAITVRTKLVLLTGLLLGGISAFIYIYFPGRTEERLLRAVAAEARDISRIAAFSAAPALYFGDPTSGLELLKGADATTDVAYVVIADANGKVFAAIHEERARLARYQGAFSAGGITPDGSVHRTALPIHHEGRRIGTLYAGLSLAPVRAEIASMHRTIALVSGLVFVLGLLVAIGIGAFVTRPLNEMVQTTRAIARGEQRRAPLRALDEVGELAVSFNSMLDAIDGARFDLEQLNRNLEQRVAERTIDLEEEILERQRGEDALRRANERFVLAAGAVNGAIYDWDMVEETVLWTDGLTRVFGYPLEEVAPTTDWWLTRIHPDDAGRVSEQLRQALEVGRDFVSEYRFRAKDGTELHVWDRGRVVRDAKGGAVRMVGIMESVTELKRLEEQYRQAQKMEAVGRLAGGVAHDFNNLLTTILGYSDLILEQIEPDDPHRPDLEEIRKAGERAASLTKQLLAFSRKQVIEPKVLEVNAIVANMEKMLCRLIGEDVQCLTELDSSAGYIRADLGQLEQVIMNVVVNARDAMPTRGRLTIRTGKVVFDEAFVRQHIGARLGHYSSIVLSDTGCGMDLVTKLRIFEPFFTTKGPNKGTGLGMATVYGIVKQSEGYITVESEPGVGTQISLYFPRVAKEGIVPAPVKALPVPRGTETVLLVEDEDAVRTLVRGVLRSRGYTVLEASNAAEAIRISKDQVGPIHILLTDVVMPEVSGRELADQLLLTRRDMLLLYMSGYTEDRVVHHGVMTSGVGFLQKPFTPDSLLRKMRETLDRRPDPVM